MERAVYQAIVEKLTLPLSAWPHFEAVARLFGVNYATVYSIYSQEVQNRVLRNNHLVKNAMPELARRYMSGADALTLAFELEFPPCMLLRRLIEELQLGLARDRISRALRQPELLPTLVSHAAVRRLVQADHPEPLPAVSAAEAALPSSGDVVGRGADAGSLRSPQCSGGRQAGVEAGSCTAAELALLDRLQRDLELCVSCDKVYSPQCDVMRHSAGQEWEERLNAELALAGVAFWTEGQLRSQGYHKTPDARLQVPIAVQGRIINWIDSKATFGDDKLHRQQMAEQYERYVNRFGPGLVIYWHGYIADLNRDDNVLLMDRFPRAEEIVQLPRLPVALPVACSPQQSAASRGANASPEPLLPSVAALPSSLAE